MMSQTQSLDPKHPAFDNLIKYAIAPRPICLASTVDQNGQVNLSPFSYFNLFSHNPPICVFAPVRRMRDGTTKHTYQNILETNELVINIVDYAMVQQQSLSSTEYPKEINEFAKAGLTEVASELVRAPRVAESPVQLECRVQQLVDLGTGPGNGTLVVAEVLRMHVRSALLDENFKVEQDALDLVARLGGDWYCRVTAENLFEVPKPLRNLGIGIDQLPEHIRLSTVLTGNHLGMLGNVEEIPDWREAEALKFDPEIKEIFDAHIGDGQSLMNLLHREAAKALDQGDVSKAWKILRLS